MPRAERRHHWFEGIADHAQDAYLRYSFTKGTVNEVDFLIETLGIKPGDRVLDVGCGPGRHSHELARRGYAVVGVDISETFIEIARRAAPGEALTEPAFVVGDARALTELDLTGGGSALFDAAFSLCQGGFGLPAEGDVDDGQILREMGAQVAPQAPIAVSAFSAYFQLRWLEDKDSFDAERGVNHEQTTIKDPSGVEENFDLWTRCFTPTELRLLAEREGLTVMHLWSVSPGKYAPNPPVITSPEFLMVARRP